ncbi:MAG: CvpA family protein [Chitinophagaceae bacterium]|nr:CvpA family protein [Chitinophagaceae bacterium]
MNFLDLVFLGMMAIAVFKGIRNGLIVAVFSLVAWIVGLIVAFRFADAGVSLLKGFLETSGNTLYIISFVLLFILVTIVINLGAKLIEKAVELVLLGWANKIGGIFFYVLLYTLLFSILVYFAERVSLVSAEAAAGSKVYPWVKPLAVFLHKTFLH